MTKIEVTDSEGIRQKQIDANKQTNGKLITLSKNKRKKVPLCLLLYYENIKTIQHYIFFYIYQKQK